MKTNFHHIGIVVKNINEAILKYCQALDVDSSGVKIHQQSYMTGKGEVEEFDYAFIPMGNNSYIELVTPTSEGPTKRYLEKKGEGLFHLAFESTNINKTVENFEKAGIQVASRTPTPTEQIFSVFLHPKSAHGVLIQLLHKNILLPDGSPNLDLVSNLE
ncbi:MAG: VOC family protein [Candidatus Hodarchaeota archaeon]